MDIMPVTRSVLRHAVRARATGLDIAILARHLLLYPSGVLPEPDRGRSAAAGPPTSAPAGQPGRSCDGRRPVLLLHGFIDNRSVFAVLARGLRRHGWDSVQAVNYSPMTSDLRHAAVLLGRHVDDMCARSGHRRVDIIGHSLGGLIARYYVQRLGGDLHVRTLVTLGTPHSGTRVMPFADTHPVVRQMRPNSELMVELAAAAAGCTTRFVAFWSAVDHWVAPVGAARLEHPDLIARNIEVYGIGHLAMPVNSTVAAKIRQELANTETNTSIADTA